MEIKYGNGKTQEGPGVSIELTGNEIAIAIDAWLVAQGVTVRGPRTIRLNGTICRDVNAHVYVDPSGFVIADGEKFDGGHSKT